MCRSSFKVFGAGVMYSALIVSTMLPALAGPGGHMPSFNANPSNQGNMGWMLHGQNFPTLPGDDQNSDTASSPKPAPGGFVRPKGLYAYLSPNHQDDSGRAELILMAPELVTANGDTASATFAPSSEKLGPFGGSVGFGLTAPKPGVYLVDVTVYPLGPYPASNTINFDVMASSGTHQVIPIAAAASSEHVSFLINATGAGKYSYQLSTNDATWIFTNCSISKL